MRQIEVAAAVIRQERAILAVQRGGGQFAGMWEFPGGKLEKGESPAQALIREILEELDAELQIHRHFMTVEYDYPDFHITLHCYLASLPAGRMTLQEHTAFRWLLPEELTNVEWLPADLPVIRALQEEDSSAAASRTGRAPAKQ